MKKFMSAKPRKNRIRIDEHIKVDKPKTLLHPTKKCGQNGYARQTRPILSFLNLTDKYILIESQCNKHLKYLIL